MKIIFQLIVSLVVVSAMVTIYSCQDDSVSMESNIPLRFSVDTLRFDTVFTELGSATRFVKIYNDLNQAIVLDEVSLDDASGFFRLNVDGTSNNTVQNVRIEAQDSIYIFAEVTIDPDMPLSISPFIIERGIDIKANDSQHRIYLESWGQNANYIPGKNSASTVNILTCNLGSRTWDDPKPYVIYGALIIDSCELIIPQGQQVYVHGGVAITDLGIYNDGLVVFLQNGSLTINGTLDNPVTIKTDRLEEPFNEVSGQWSGILMTAGSSARLSHTIIENSIVGLSVDSTAEVRLDACTIAHTSGSAISASNGTIFADNSLFYDNGGFGLSLNFGGNYNFNYCTVSNYNNQDQALFLNNFRCENSECSEVLANPLRATFTNCIFVGNDRDEISLADITAGDEPDFFDYNLENCMVVVDELLDADAFPNFFDRCLDCKNVTRSDSIFLDLDAFDFSLDTMSIAIDMGKNISGINTDIIGNPRAIDQPDMGCYEFQK